MDSSKQVQFAVLRSTGQDASKLVNFSVVRPAGANTTKLVNFAVLRDTAEKLSKQVSYAVIDQTAEIASKLVGYAVIEQTAEIASKLVSYAVLDQLGEQASKLVSYVILETISEAVAKALGVAVLAPTIDRSAAAKLIGAAVLVPTDNGPAAAKVIGTVVLDSTPPLVVEQVSKLVSYAVLETPPATASASKLVSYAVLEAPSPEQASKLVSYAVLEQTAEQASKLVSYAVLEPPSPGTLLAVAKEIANAVLIPVRDRLAAEKIVSTAVLIPVRDRLAAEKIVSTAVLTPTLDLAALAKHLAVVVLQPGIPPVLPGPGIAPKPAAPLVKVTAFEIPTRPGRPQHQLISLAGVRYNLDLYWDVPASLWMLDIADINDDPILGGIPLVTGVDLLEQHQHLGIGGALVVQDDFDWRVTPTFDNLGVYGHLYFIPTRAAAAPTLKQPMSPEVRTRAGAGTGILNPPRPPSPMRVSKLISQTVLGGLVPRRTPVAYSIGSWGTAVDSNEPTPPLTATISTQQPNDIIIFHFIFNAEGQPPYDPFPGIVTGIEGGGVVWHRRLRTGGQHIDGFLFGDTYINSETWWAVAPTVLTDATITITYDQDLSFVTYTALGITGANPAAPWGMTAPAINVHLNGPAEQPYVAGVTTDDDHVVMLWTLDQFSIVGLLNGPDGYTRGPGGQNVNAFIGLITEDYTFWQVRNTGLINETLAEVPGSGFGSAASGPVPSYIVIADAISAGYL